jgi:hypothetical protein
MSYSEQPDNEGYNPWTVVNLVFRHLADEGLHPVLGGPGNPGTPAADLLSALGIEPVAGSNPQVAEQVKTQLDELRVAAFGERA